MQVKDVKTTLEYSGAVVTEPQFTLQCTQKTPADYARQSKSMTLKIPAEKQAFLMQLSEDPRVPYSRSRVKEINAMTLQNQDETFAMINNHVSHLKIRDKSTVKYKDLLRRATKND